MSQYWPVLTYVCEFKKWLLPIKFLIPVKKSNEGLGSECETNFHGSFSLLASLADQLVLLLTEARKICLLFYIDCGASLKIASVTDQCNGSDLIEYLFQSCCFSSVVADEPTSLCYDSRPPRHCTAVTRQST